MKIEEFPLLSFRKILDSISKFNQIIPQYPKSPESEKIEKSRMIDRPTPSFINQIERFIKQISWKQKIKYWKKNNLSQFNRNPKSTCRDKPQKGVLLFTQQEINPSFLLWHIRLQTTPIFENYIFQFSCDLFFLLICLLFSAFNIQKL